MKFILKPLTLCLLSSIVIISCKKKEQKESLSVENPKKNTAVIQPKEKLQEIVISLNNIKSRDSVLIDKRIVRTWKTAIYTTFSDSLETIKKPILNKTPINETITYKIKKNDFINFKIDAALAKYNYFLKGGDSLTVDFNKDGFVSKSSLNGNDDNAALLFSKNKIPVRTLEYMKLFRKHYGRVNDKVFSTQFDKKFQKNWNKASSEVEKLKDSVTPVIHKALKKHLKYIKIENDYAKGEEVNIPFDDFSMSVLSYRNLKRNMLDKISQIDYIDDEKQAIEESMHSVDYLMKNDSLKNYPKTRNMLLREVLDITGQYEPNLIPELISQISDPKIKKEYSKVFTSQYLLDLNKYQNDTENINLISVDNPKKVFSFQNFLDQHKGKVVYVDLWASWCGPCRKQLVPSHKLQKELKNKPIVFSYFSTDKSFAKWKTAQLEEEMAEEPNSFLLLNTKKSKKYNSWKVRGIPRYLIFDKTGELVVEDAPTPSNPEAKELLLKYAN